MKKRPLIRRTWLTAAILLIATVALAATIVGTNGTFTTSVDANGWYKTTYTPKTSGAKCNNIYMVQTLKITDQGGKKVDPKAFGGTSLDHMSDDMTSNGTMVDHLACEKDPYYNGTDAGKDTESKGSNDGTTATPTSMEDRPSVPDGAFPSGVTSVTFNFEVCAVCKDDGKILDCYTWTWSRTQYDSTNGTSTSGTTAQDPSSEFTAAKKKYEKNHKDGTVCPEEVAESNAGTGNATSTSGKITPESPAPGTPFVMEWDIINTSGIDLVNVEYEVFLDGMSLTGGTVPFIEYFDFETVLIDMPGLPLGPHSVIVEVDPFDTIPEYDETDNATFEEFEITEVTPVADETQATGLFLQMLQPNPTHGDFKVMLRLGTDAPAVLRVVDLRGRVVETRTIHDVAGNLRTERVRLDSRQAAGTYFVILEQGGTVETRKFILLK